MKIILLDDVTKVGRRGEVRDVSDGYARNFLIPKRLALSATAGNLKNLEHIKKQREGTYAVFEVSAEPSMVKEFERQARLNENVLRFVSTRVPIRKKARPAKTQEVLEEVS